MSGVNTTHLTTAHPAIHHPGGGPRLLIADDQDDVLAALNLLLKNEGFESDFAHSPAEVVRAVQAHPYDLLLLDMNYARDTTSGAEGLELLSAINHYDASLPVVLMTAWSTVDLAVRSMRSGGRDFVQKPWDNAQLLETIRRSLEKRTGGGVGLADRDIVEASRIQRRLLPDVLPAPPGCEIRGSWHPASAIGGDYYDAFQLDSNRVAFCVADVAGKGLPAALLMSNVQAGVRAEGPRCENPATVCARVNQAILERTPAEKFVTFFYGVLDLATRRVRYTNAGHPPPVVVSPEGSPTRLTEGGTVLGLFPDSAYEEGEFTLGPAGRIVMFTDGLTEAEHPTYGEFGDERLVDLIQRNRGCSSYHFHDVLLGAVRAYAGRLKDDATLLTVSLA